MKLKRTFYILAIFISLKGIAQNTFENGYYINNSDEKIDCLIKNLDWLNNPTEFDYKISDSSERKTMTIDSVKEFGILNISKYIRQNVKIDRSSNEVSELDYNGSPKFLEEILFLKVLIEGKASLYSYADSGLVRYFYKNSTSEIEQLVHKTYLNNKGEIKHNNQFRQQLLNSLNNEKISINTLKDLQYNRSDLTKVFVKYNEGSNSEFINYDKTEKRDLFNLTLRPGVRFSTLYIGGSNGQNIYFGNGLISYSFGVESEFILGFNNNRWSFLIESTYTQFDSGSQSYVISETTSTNGTANIHFQSVEFSVGVRRYFFLSKEFKLSANASLHYAHVFNSQIEVLRIDTTPEEILSLDIPVYSNELSSYNMGMIWSFGCKYRDRYSLEIREFRSKNLLTSQGAWGTHFSSISLVLGYSFF